ncbi:acetylneuraminate ABC transporter [Edwardsiella ictaluri]|uniref:Transporter, solute:sodium symporter (SSS) family n=2 Tax=Edwardsiella ictaluri TaxID=67780 RepID=C5BBJ0_EDWI9|nr:sodium:solute symporter [Edwardsiella ictaluri]ACR68221.1 transporter, solute:sodium symporter (SSS) family [Edwardsiella ictaluri 93-146]AVZ81403.1 acetylneuraminate ABC transporter [Edwardsiella ictaluri]EKS7762638.1 sodium:solute symporter [Edwardsiella ictaluri]EKS7769340.1 sodium:solute symporter [Edwardsiella ictaluri]EKS7772489.1 sodium:solute symporter [Edwardsiella ictaluri]
MQTHDFGFLNYAVLFGYLLAMMLVGVYFAKRQKTADDYFRGGGRVPGWAAGVSVFATTLSSITFMSIPAKAYTSDWTFIIGQYLAIAILPLVFYFYIPFFRKLKITSAYEYLEARFDVRSRLFASLSFMLFHIGRIAIITYLTVLALRPFLAIDPVVLVLLISILCIIYTWMGGIEGVIWTDVIQGLLLSGGAVLIFIMICWKVNGGIGEIYSVTAGADKFFPDSQFHWSWTNSTIPVLMIGFLFANIQQFTASQDVVQRYIVTDSIEETKRTLITNAKLVAIIPIFFFAIGSALFVYYQQNPQLLPEGFNTGGILPLFVVTEMPGGIAGLIIAAIFAAAQSSISSSLNSISSCFNSDIYVRLSRQERSAPQKMKIARLVIILAGLLSSLATIWLVLSNESEIWDAFNSLIGLMGGPMTGLFMLGIFFKRANAGSAFCGILVSIVAVLLTRYASDLNFFFYGVVGAMSVVVVGVLAAPLFAPAKQVTLDRERA